MSEKPGDRKTDRPVGYTVAIPRKRVSRPVHANRKAALAAAAEAAFKPKPNAEAGNPESKN